MPDLVLTIPSKGRIFGETFNLLRLNKKLEVFVYVDELEHAAYREAYPGYNIIPHRYNTISEIRYFMQEHQCRLNNNQLILDDDVKYFTDLYGYVQPLDCVLDMVRNALNDFNYVSFYIERSIPSAKFLSPAEGAITFTPNLYKNNVRYDKNMLSEDFAFGRDCNY
ncbi:hypothetical protein NO2_1720 [Candidatus Termititenax persephonae]|uniref:Uncharacterized protein n=1 Tax=Candidatus Termititenax persephonae TaxID=2218525 RepID=A0A388TJ66_9BACT|nr:hypothetical protein NO2_1720 [Candidatus Termititenax persephonae]